MRSCLFALAVLFVLAAGFDVAAAARMPSGSYCGSYIFVIKGKISFASAEKFDFHLDLAGSNKDCNSERYVVAPDGKITLPDEAKDGNCIGELMKDNDLDSLDIKYDAGRNVIDLDAGVAKVTLKQC